MVIGSHCGLISDLNGRTLYTIGIGLLALGIGYNMLVAWIERHGYDEGYTAILVVVGTLFTLGGVALVDVRAAFISLGAFACSGTPMILGSWWRYARARRNAQRAMLEEVARDKAA